MDHALDKKLSERGLSAAEKLFDAKPDDEKNYIKDAFVKNEIAKEEELRF